MCQRGDGLFHGSSYSGPVRVPGMIALVTGASSGIGRATAIKFARRGAVVAATARREAMLAETVDACARKGGISCPL